MKTNQRFIVILVGMLTLLLLANLLNVGYNFRVSSMEASSKKAAVIADIVKDGLTAHMINDTMDKRNLFLDRIAHKNGIEKLWVVRSDLVNHQYGNGLPREAPHDAIDRSVLAKGVTQQKITHTDNRSLLRITIPYIASLDETSPSCLSCHKVKPNAVLGAVSMTMDVSSMQEMAKSTLIKIFLINILFIVIGLGITNYFFKPYVRFFDSLKEGIQEAYRGNFSYRFPKTLKDDAGELTDHLNDLYNKMDETFGRIQHDMGTFLMHKSSGHDDPLREAQVIIQELSDIYKFKRTIELDATKEEIYRRIIHVIHHKFGAETFSLYEIDKRLQTRALVYSTLEEDHCTLPEDQTHDCRAYRTHAVVYSSDFHDLCAYCRPSSSHYLCIPITINDQVALTLTLYTDTTEKLEEFYRLTSSIKNYFETAKPVIEGRILTSQLRESSLKDGMTGLYNRRFLEEFIDKVMSQTLREEKRYYILMLDIDYFKLVNDTYGHDAGDVVIKRLSKLIVNNIRTSDLAIRYGGEEFLVMLHNSTEEGALKVANNIQTLFDQESFKLEGDTVKKTISIGVAAFPADSDAIWKAIKYADIALYEAKNTGRNRIVRYTTEMFHYDEKSGESETSTQ
jgi:diguanylate cyclase (GGDEF)-like protein